MFKLIKDMKKHPSLIPLATCVVVGGLGAGLYLLRLATRSPDVTWNRTKNPEPWQEYKDKQYKFYSPTMDYSQIKSPAPNFKDI